MYKTILLAVGMLLLTNLSLMAQWSEEIKLSNISGSYNPAIDDHLGEDVAVSGNYAIVGVPLYDGLANLAGAAIVYFYNGSNWVEQAVLNPLDGQEFDQFGYSVDIDGSTAVVGAWYEYELGTQAGAAYVFERTGTTWTQTQKLTASDGAASDVFASSVSISGSKIIIGSPMDDDAGSSSGSAYVFSFDGNSWFEQQKLTASDEASGDFFGGDVDIHGDIAVIGARGNDDVPTESGSAYVFRFGGLTWAEEQKLLSSDLSQQDYFGFSVTVWDSTVVVGAYGDDDNGSLSGSAYVFDFNGASWIESQKLTASDGEDSDQFSRPLTIENDRLVIGAKWNEGNGFGSGSGAAYIFERDGTWVEQQKIFPADGAETDSFGGALGVSGDKIVVGALGNDENGSNSGAAYIYRLSGVISSQENAKDDFAIYPNPTNGRFRVQLGNSIIAQQLELIDMTGKTCSVISVPQSANFEIDVDLDSGIYFLHVTHTDGVLVQRVVLK